MAKVLVETQLQSGITAYARACLVQCVTNDAKVSKYFALKENGLDAMSVCQVGINDGLTNIKQILMLRAVYGCELGKAKEIKLRADGIDSEEYSQWINELVENFEKYGDLENS